MTYLIDGYNLIYKFPDLELLMLENNLELARKKLLDRLKTFSQITGKHIRIVFDGKKNIGIPISSEKMNKIDVFYSLHYSADHLIKEFIKKDLNSRNTTVVTSDKDIILFVKKYKTKTLTSEDFAIYLNDVLNVYYEQQIPEKDENPRLSKEEIEYWEQIFKSRNKK